MLLSYERRLEIVRPIKDSGVYFQSFHAVELGLDRPVFLKWEKLSDDQLARQVVEAHVRHWRALAREPIPSMPALLDVGCHEGRWFATTEWISAPALSHSVREPQKIAEPQQFVFNVFERCLWILSHLHHAGFVHGDLSFGNILAAPNVSLAEVHLVDPAPPLDLPDPKDASRRLILANPNYMAPEVLSGRPLTARSDLYALGKLVLDLASALRVSAPSLALKLVGTRPQDRPATAQVAWREVFNDSAVGRTHIPAQLVPAKTVLMSVPSEEQRSAVSMAISVPVPRPQATRTSANVPTRVASVPAGPPVQPIHADFSVMAPSIIQAGRNFVIEVWVAQSCDHDKMLMEATRSGRMIRRGSRSQIEIDRDSLITVMLKLPDFEVPDPIEILSWNGSIRNVGFIVRAPAGLAPGIYPGAIKLMLQQVPFASILFDLEVTDGATAEVPRELSTRVQRVTRAFASYASADRGEVLRRAQGIKATGTNIFLDIVALRSGDDWEPSLFREIDASDRFFLFWSRNAAQSTWVEREWRYALERRGLEFIDPLPLEDPRRSPPPKELDSKHFNDMMLAFITAEDVLHGGSSGA